MAFDPAALLEDLTTTGLFAAGVVLPVATVAVVRWLVVAGGLPPVVLPIGLLLLPLLGALGTIAVGALATPGGVLGRERTVGDRIPDHQRAAIDPETLDRSVDDGSDRVDRFRRYYACFLLATPLWALLFGVV